MVELPPAPRSTTKEEHAEWCRITDDFLNNIKSRDLQSLFPAALGERHATNMVTAIQKLNMYCKTRKNDD